MSCAIANHASAWSWSPRRVAARASGRAMAPVTIGPVGDRRAFANGARRSTSVRAALAVAGDAAASSQAAHGRQPRDVVGKVEAGGGFGGEAFVCFVEASDLTEHVR